MDGTKRRKPEAEPGLSAELMRSVAVADWIVEIRTETSTSRARYRGKLPEIAAALDRLLGPVMYRIRPKKAN